MSCSTLFSFSHRIYLVEPRRNQRYGFDKDEGDRRGLPWTQSHPRRCHRPSLYVFFSLTITFSHYSYFVPLQTSTTLSARPPRMPEPSPVSKSSVSSTSLLPPPSPTVSTRRVVNLRSSSTISEEEPSMFHFSPLTTVSSRFWPPLVTPILEVKISITASSSTSSSRTRRRLAPMLARTFALLGNSSVRLKRPRGPCPANRALALKLRASKMAMTSQRLLLAPSSKNSTWTSSGRQ